jgi:hypothetical protein
MNPVEQPELKLESQEGGDCAINRENVSTMVSETPFNRERKMKENLRIISRCTGLALVIIAALVLVPAVASADVGGVLCDGLETAHGVGIEKNCSGPINRCGTNADCSDADFCNGTEICATVSEPGSNVVSCTITLTNPESHCDSLEVFDADDTIEDGTGSPLTSNTLLIVGTTGEVSGDCGVDVDLSDPTFTCTLAPGATITVLSNFYEFVYGVDPNTLNDTGRFRYRDVCDGGTTNCSLLNNATTISGSTPSVDGCSDGADPCPVDDGAFCNGPESCDEATDTCSEATNPCTDTLCTECIEATDTCDPIAPPPDGCVNEEICRTPGFWGTHGGVEKEERSTNITLALLDAYNAANVGNELTICGVPITNTDCGSPNSALEAICVSPKGDQTLQLARQLTAAALNCIITNAEGVPVDSTCTDFGAGLTGSVCDGVSIEAIFDLCNAACASGEVDADLDNDPSNADVSCIAAIDCFNNGFIVGPDGECTGDSSGCHDEDRLLVNGCFDFDPPGAAGSPRECNDSRKNCITIFGTIEGCTTGIAPCPEL